MRCRIIEPVNCFLKILLFSLINILNEGLRIPVEEREPAALYLDHDFMPLQKGMIYILQVKFHTLSLYPVQTVEGLQSSYNTFLSLSHLVPVPGNHPSQFRSDYYQDLMHLRETHQ